MGNINSSNSVQQTNCQKFNNMQFNQNKFKAYNMQQVSPRVFNTRTYPAANKGPRNTGLNVDMPPLQIANIELAAVNGDIVPDSPS